MMTQLIPIVILSPLVIITFFLFLLTLKNFRGCSRTTVETKYKPLQNKVVTEYFDIDISYDVINSGRVSATFKVVRCPNYVRRIIYNGGSLSLDSSYDGYLVINSKSIEELRRNVAFTISYTMDKIKEVENNIRVVETNNLVLEIGNDNI